MFVRALLLIPCFIVSSIALYAPPKGAITVGGSRGQYANLSAALADNSSLVSHFREVSEHWPEINHTETGLLHLPGDLH